MFFVVIVVGAIALLHWRLFDYLRSDQGRSEFRTPPSESGAVVKSTALQIVWLGATFLLALPLVNPESGRVRTRGTGGQSAQAPEASPDPTLQSEAQARAEAAFEERHQRILRRQRERRAADSEAREDAVTQPAGDAEEDRATTLREVVKCLDAAGNVQYAAFCPAGSSPVP
jgi:hypothetical protein